MSNAVSSTDGPALGALMGSGRPIVIRTWTVAVHNGRLEAFRHFARTRSFPMFRRQEGLLGVLFLEQDDGATQVVITIWRDPSSIERMTASLDYRSTAAALTASGVLANEPVVDLYRPATLPSFLEVN